LLEKAVLTWTEGIKELVHDLQGEEGARHAEDGEADGRARYDYGGGV